MYKLLLCRRYLRTRLIALASIVSVMLGVATMVVVNAVMTGFSTEMKDRIHGMLADVVVEARSTDGFNDPDLLMSKIEQAVGDDVAAMTPTVEIYGMLSHDYMRQMYHRPVTLIGIQPDGKDMVSPISQFLMTRSAQLETKLEFPIAKHAADAPLDWSLTPEAIEERRYWVDQMRYRAAYDESGARPLDFAEPADGTEAAALMQTAELDPIASATPAADPTTDSVPYPTFNDKAPADFFETGDAVANSDAADADPFYTAPEESTAQASPTLDDADPFAASMSAIGHFDPANVPDFAADLQLEPRDPYEPLPARLYVGAGLVSFPNKNHRTGETETVTLVRPGQDVTLSTIKTGMPDPVKFQATVVDLFQSGMAEYDQQYVFCNIDQLQIARGMMIKPPPGETADWRSGAVTSVQIRLAEGADSDAVVERLQELLYAEMYAGEDGVPRPLYTLLDVSTWEDKQSVLLEAVAMEAAVLNVLLSLIVTVAGFGILAIFFMIVVEKTKDIGTLKALGASARGVMSIFLGYGLSLGIVGAGCGIVLGLLFVANINTIEDWLSWITGQEVFSAEVYFFSEIPTVVHPSMVVAVAVGAIAIATLASVLPAMRAARMHPVEALRYQ